MWPQYAAVLVGFVLLVWGADRFVIGAAATAQRLGVSALLIGLTVVGLGTSAPEMMVSISAAIEGSSELAVGNALGSNIANMGLILGITALVLPLSVRSETVRREFPMLLAITVAAASVFLNDYLGRIEGFALLLGLIAMMAWLVHIEKPSAKPAPQIDELEVDIPSDMSLGKALLLLAFGLVVLLVGAQLLVFGAKGIARSFGVSELMIGLPVVAIGTSLPELAASISAALKGEHDMAIGNVIGSNMYNLLAVVGLAGAIHPTALSGKPQRRRPSKSPRRCGTVAGFCGLSSIHCYGRTKILRIK